MADKTGIPLRTLLRGWGSADVALVRALRRIEGEEHDRRELEHVHQTRRLPGK